MPEEGRIFRALESERAVVIGALGLVVALAWAWLVAGAGLAVRAIPMAGMPTAWGPAHLGLVFVMWAVMMVAMMLPAAAPVVLLVARISGERAESPIAATLFVLGYLAVWTGVAAAATGLEWALAMAGRLSQGLALADAAIAGAVMIAAGFYQWTPLKAACLRHCRSPLEFLLFHWRSSASGAFLSGIRHGAFCLGCCWMLMALIFVGGVMSLSWIGAIALLVLIEKTLPWGGRMGRVVGGVLAAAGIATLAFAF